MSMNEEWRDIEQLSGEYQISNLGRVRRAKPCSKKCCTDTCRHIGQIIKPEAHPKGYQRLRLRDKRIRLRVHRLVAEAFIPNPLNKAEVNHKDGNTFNNRLDNLEWCSSEENNRWNDFLAFSRVMEEIKTDTDFPLDHIRDLAEKRYRIPIAV